MNHKSRKIYYAAAALLWIVIWQVAVTYVNRRLLIPIPTPVSTAAALIRLSADRSFFHAVFLSILRITVGFLSAFVVGTLLAVLSVKSEFVHVLTAPLLQLIRAIPVASFTILVFLWVTRERIPSVISFFTVLPVIWANVESGLRAADEGLVEMARVFGLPNGRILREILLPSIRPYIASAAANGIGFAWKSGVAAEVICRTQDSLGNLLWQGKSTVDYDEVFAVTLVIVALSILLQWAASLLLRGRLGAQRAARRPAERAEAGASAGLQQQGAVLRSAGGATVNSSLSEPNMEPLPARIVALERVVAQEEVPGHRDQVRTELCEALQGLGAVRIMEIGEERDPAGESRTDPPDPGSDHNCILRRGKSVWAFAVPKGTDPAGNFIGPLRTVPAGFPALL